MTVWCCRSKATPDRLTCDLAKTTASSSNLTSPLTVSQQAPLFVSQPAHSATPVDIGFGHMGLDDVANSTSTQPLDQAVHDALSKAALFLATAGHAVAGEKIKLADYVIGEGNLLPSVTALFSTLDRVHPVDVEDIDPHEQPASYKEDAVLRPCHLQADSTGHPPAIGKGNDSGQLMSRLLGF